MKKKLAATLLLSTVILSNLSTAVVLAEDTDTQIAAKDEKISEIESQQATAQEQVDALQAQVDAIRAEQDTLTAENDRLNEESQQLSAEITQLSADIVSRDEALKKQARSAQVDGSATSYINTILDSKSIADAVSRVTAMREIISANNTMLEQQKEDKEAIAEKQVANQEAINTVLANTQKLEDDAQSLQSQEAQLKVAQLNLAAEKATAEDEKAALLEEKAAAEAAAAAAVAAETAYQEQQAASTAAVTASATTQEVTAVQSLTTTSSVSYSSSSANTYPTGQCTWGAKVLAPWAGSYWGNGGQWATSAAAAGFRTGSTPSVGAIACWNDGGYGHVAVVTAVQSTTSIQVSEANYLGNSAIGNYRGWFDPTTCQGTVTYIYPN